MNRRFLVGVRKSQMGLVSDTRGCRGCCWWWSFPHGIDSANLHDTEASWYDSIGYANVVKLWKIQPILLDCSQSSAIHFCGVSITLWLTSWRERCRIPPRPRRQRPGIPQRWQPFERLTGRQPRECAPRVGGTTESVRTDWPHAEWTSSSLFDVS